MEENYLKNMEVGGKRVELENFFNFYKHGKMIRYLR